MARLARIVIPGIPYHVTQRGNRRQQRITVTATELASWRTQKALSYSDRNHHKLGDERIAAPAKPWSAGGRVRTR